MDTKITEIIPDNTPEWAIKAMAEGQLFNEIVRREKNTVCVPLEPTEEMCAAALDLNQGTRGNYVSHADIYKAMIKASRENT